MNPFLARFDGQPALVASEMKGLFESCLHQAALIQARLDSASDKPVMADDFWYAENDWRAFLRPYIVRDGILQIPVKGVLLHDFPYQFGGWATGYEYIWQAFKRGQSDGSVKGVAFICDSPGGMVAGCFDMVDRIEDFPDRKPLRAFAQESAYSAAYAVAAVADKIIVSRTGGVGSIGVVMMHIDLSKSLEDYGVKITFIHFGKHKVDGNSYEPLSDDVKNRFQARVDELGEVFVSSVARNREMEEQAVRDTEALCFTATQAKSNGLADDIGSLEDAVATFLADLSNVEGETAMADFTQEAYDQGVTTARKDGFDAGKVEGEKVGATAERTRISAILDSEEGKKRPAAALAAALDTDMTAEQAGKFLSKLAEEGQPQGKSKFEQAMESGQNADLGLPGEGAKEKSRAERAADAAYGQRRSKAA